MKKIENENQSIVMMDIASQYPCETAKKNTDWKL